MEYVHSPERYIGKCTDVFADPYGITAIVQKLDGERANLIRKLKDAIDLLCKLFEPFEEFEGYTGGIAMQRKHGILREFRKYLDSMQCVTAAKLAEYIRESCAAMCNALSRESDGLYRAQGYESFVNEQYEMDKEEFAYQCDKVCDILKRLEKFEKGANEMSNNENWSYEKDAPSFDRQFSAINTFINTHVVANKEELMEKIRLLERSMKSVCDDYDNFRRTAKERTAVDYSLRSDAARATTPNRIWHNYGKDGKWYTTVEWKDGTKTTVGRTVDSKTWIDSYCGYTGFSCALAKKLYGSTTESTKTYMDAVDRVDEPKREKEQIRAHQKWAAEVRRVAEKNRRERLIREKMEEIQITNEAHSRMLTEFRQRETFVPEPEEV